MHLATYLGLLDSSERTLADAFRQVADGHGDEPDIVHLCHEFAGQADRHVHDLSPVVDRFGEEREQEPERLHAAEFGGTRTGGVGLLRDLQDLYVLASLVDITWTAVAQAARGLRDRELIDLVAGCEQEVSGQLAWLRTRLKQSATQALIVAS
jgi:hypothetical protein